MNWLIIIIFWALSLPSILLATQSTVRVLPEGRLFTPTFSDPREISMSLIYQADSKIAAHIGNYISLLSLEGNDESIWKFHFGLEGAGFFSLKRSGGRFPLETTDGMIGTYFEGKKEAIQFQLRFMHVSSHLSDGSSEVPTPYSREYLSFRTGYAFNRSTHFYAGPSFLVHAIPTTGSIGFQWGGTSFLPLQFSHMTPFFGVDFKWHSETTYNPSMNLQLGIALFNPPDPYRSFSIFYAYFTGTDPRGQFFRRTLTTHSMGLQMHI